MKGAEGAPGGRLLEACLATIAAREPMRRREAPSLRTLARATPRTGAR